MDRSPLLLPRILDEGPLPGPHSSENLYGPPLNGHDVCPADGLDDLGLEVCQLPDPALDICPLPPVRSDSGTGLGPTSSRLELFSNAIASDLAEILLSQDETAVISSAQ